MNKKEISILLGLIFAVIFSIAAGDITSAEKIKGDTLRLHIIANSNTEIDQQTKLLVRDKIQSMPEIECFSADNFDTALQNTNKNLPLLSENINSFLQQQGIGYNAKFSIEPFYFDTTKYDGFVLPQGEYTALTVRLGEAKGKNWWCVMYPSLCSAAFSEQAFEKTDDFVKSDEIALRFKTVEIYEDIKNLFVEKSAQDYPA